MESPHDIAQKTLEEVLHSMGASYSDVSREKVAEQTVLAIRADDARPLIGMHGDTVYAIDHLVKKIVEKKLVCDTPENAPEGALRGSSHDVHFFVDVNEYRTKQIRDLQTKALMMAERARSFQYDVELSPMSSYERLIVHTTLSDAPNVKTESQGEGRSRRVVIRYFSQEQL